MERMRTKRPHHCVTLLLLLALQNTTHALPPAYNNAAQTTRLTTQHSTTNIPPKTAVIIGGGPAGLAAALTLSTLSTFSQITVLETRSEICYEPSRAYFYNVNRRGQKFCNLFGIDLSVCGFGVSEFARQTVPADPKELFDGSEPFSREMSDEERMQMGTLYWVPRHEFTRALMERVEREGKIRVLLDTGCRRVEPMEEGGNGRVRIVTTKGEEGAEETMAADLVVGADGIGSIVRQSLEAGLFKDWVGGNGRNFRLRKWKSPSTGLRIKGLQLLPNFRVPMGDGKSLVHIESRYNYALDSITDGPTDRLSLMILPQKDAEASRSINICTMPNHDIWNMTTTSDLKKYFKRAFPRFDWNTIVAPEEWDAFIAAKGAEFPFCQYSHRLHVSSNDYNDGGKGGSGIVLVGDALHAFPPDLGQGVNSALCDVVTLGECFVNNEDDILPIPAALKRYGKRNGPETRALVKLARCGAPYQYGQSSYFMRFGKTLWTLNVAVRLFLNKLTLNVSPKPAILRMMNPERSFRRVMFAANVLTAVLWTVLVSLIYEVVGSL